MKCSLAAKIYATATTMIVCFSIVLQFVISLKQANYNYVETLKIFLSFFTVTTNMIVGSCFLVISIFPKGKIGAFFRSPSTITAITVYIVVVGLIYNLLLRGLVVQEGWSRVADELLHVLSPLLVLIFWIFFVDKSTLRYSSAKQWLIYPLAYIAFVVVRGLIINQYPYPFINVVNLGYPKAIVNAFFCVVLFWLLSVLLIWIGKRSSKL
ncbi:Pr6Pr family membrane protein [Pedobacter frigidisoli]|uniref:Pr6Pr family membrane protein n=1 Tax=Pedobacter frigidisoli TaxID=2530455 RepID=UPI0029315DDA|nr:Pr6Pr family membrane protein [Pedobacter frigidisoli]